MGGGFLPFVIVLTVIVFVHEMGHFLVARCNDVHVTTFSIGYGPEIFGWTDKKGTRWRFSWIPLGGYVMMLGDADASSVRTSTDGLTRDEIQKTLPSKTPLQRMAVAFGGPLMNIIFTLLIFVLMGLWKGIPEMQPRIQTVLAESLAERSGLQSGDLITGVNEVEVRFFSEMKKQFEVNMGKDVVLHYKRGDLCRSTTLALYKTENGEKIPQKTVGISLSGEIIFVEASVFEAIKHGVLYCYAAAVAMVSGIARAITGQKDGAKLGGVLSIGDIANKSMESGVVSFLNFMAMLSFSLAIFNLLPIPVLDGGSIAISLVEFIRRKPLLPSTVNLIYSIGLVAVVGLMIWATWNDLVNYGVIKKISNFFKGLIK